MQNTTTQWRRRNNEDERHSLLENIPLTLLKRFVCERELKTEQNCSILIPTLMAISVVSFSFSWCSTGGPGAQLSAECWLSLPHLVTNGSGLQTNWLPVFTELYNSSIAHSVSLEWHVWSSSSGNNCHALHGSLSSSASVYDCTMGFYLVPYCQPSPPTRFLPITAIGMCHFRCHWNGMFGRVEGQYTTDRSIVFRFGDKASYVNHDIRLIFLNYKYIIS